MKTIDIDLLRDIVTYNRETGEFFWRNRPRSLFKSDRSYKIFNTRYAGKKCGALTNGYLAVGFNNSLFYCHRLAWAIHYGYWPDTDIDHINMDKTDNRISNLRLVNRRGNMSNISVTKGNSSGFIGVHWAKRERKWLASITVNKKTQFIGYFECKKDAALAYNEKAAEFNGELASKKIQHNLMQIAAITKADDARNDDLIKGRRRLVSRKKA
ncbi:hypothetical protein CKG00_01270 [Morganella morganii]|uniref:HNH nuclease domain-containing protein n=1 Tax=Morganella morganii TaxID=582 RepID=A0A433ZST7_MORMO|nr:HNH endonuclease signature motif containing protein [Morganella morganii]RUT65187.1 hypothetical protein CKG00_01270 [Morganella morganii]